MATHASVDSAIASSRLKNELAYSISPYLRGHKDNPVSWQEWNPQTLSLARQLDRLIFLSIGYNACHWCHVMERESFSSPDIASTLNHSFIPIKVDRESRPDIDEIYMNYVTATTGSGGWPLNVFLTPDLQPVFGGTYWPGPSTTLAPSAHHASVDGESHLTFAAVLAKMQMVWSMQRDRCNQSAQDITRQLREFAAEGIQHHHHASDSSQDEPLELDLLDDALDHFIGRYDQANGGFSPSTGYGPKFPNPPSLTFLLRIGASVAVPSTHTRFGFRAPVPGILGKESCTTAATIALHTLLSMSRSGLRDHLGFGFHRYSVTPDWNLPHFEKMLPDNALLMSCYCDAWALSKDPEILGTIYNLVEYFTNPDSPVVHPEGGWYSSEDADSLPLKSVVDPIPEKKEGAYYTWNLKEFQSILGQRDAAILAHHFGVKADGNVPADHDIHDDFLTQNVLHIKATPSILAKELGLTEDEIVKTIKAGRTRLAEYRDSQRSRPDVDTKIIASWNGLAITALTRAANTLAGIDKERSQRCIDAAQKAATFVHKNMYDESTGSLDRVYTRKHTTNGVSSAQECNEAFLDDYAHLTLAASALYDLTFHQPHLDWAFQLQDYTISHFQARNGGFYQAPLDTSEHTQRIINLKPGSDTSLPSSNGLVATNLFYLASYLDTLSQPSQSNSNTTSTFTSTIDPSKASTYIHHARKILSAFSIEMLQHPFLFPTLLSALVMDNVTIKSLVVPKQVNEREIRRLRGWGRTVVKGDVDTVMVCDREAGEQGGMCRELRDGELDDVDFDE